MPAPTTLFPNGSMQRSAVVAAVVLAVCALVGLTASGVGLVAAPIRLDGGWALVIRASGILVGMVGLAVLIVQRRRMPPADDRAPDPTAGALSMTATIMCVLVLLALLAPRMATVEEQASQARSSTVEGDSAGGSGAGSAGLLPQATGAGGAGAGASGRSGGGSAEDRLDRSNSQNGGGEAGADLLARLVNVLLSALLVVISVLAFFLLRGRSDPGDAHLRFTRPVAAADAEAGLQASLGEVAYDGSDPRAQITAAYRRLLSALAAAGAPREPQEAPYEYLARALGPLGVRMESMHRLTELYVIAQFSDHRVDEQHRILAVAALEDGLSNLRALRDTRASAAGVAA